MPRSVVPPKASDLLRPSGDYFGVSTLGTPRPQETEQVTEAAGAHPTVLEYFANWTQEFNPAQVDESWLQGAIPLLTWEPSGGSHAVDQRDYTLARIADGDFDAYITRFAAALRDERFPVVLRFAQEMNSNWYPWTEANGGNTAAGFVTAWRHVHDLFANVGATNVIWLWSPNVLRGTAREPLADFYPGDAYVDWVGLDAYGLGESTAGEVLDQSVGQITAFTRKPLLIAETGAEPGAEQAPWTASLFTWLKQHRPRVIGFVWFEHSVAEGGKHDYRFTVDPATESAFRAGLQALPRRPWPVWRPPSTPTPG